MLSGVSTSTVTFAGLAESCSYHAWIFRELLFGVLRLSVRLKGIVKDLAQKQGVTVLISSHDLMHVTDVCERIVVLEKGEIVKDLVTSEATLKELEQHFAG